MIHFRPSLDVSWQFKEKHGQKPKEENNNECCSLAAGLKTTVPFVDGEHEQPWSGPGPLSGVPLQTKFLQTLNGPSMMNDPYRGTSLAQRMGPAQFDTGANRVDIALVKHTPMGQGRVSGVYKDDRPVSFFCVPAAGYKWQVMSKVSTVWCKRFDGSTFEEFAEDVFRDQNKRPCVVAEFFSAKGRAVQLWNSTRCLEVSCRLCKAISDKTIGAEEGDALFRLLFEFAQTGWILLGPGMTKATEGDPQFVQRNAEGTAASHQWVSGIAHILATLPGAEGDEGTPQKPLTRGKVITTRGAYAYLGGACGNGCGTPNVGACRCIQCTIVAMTLGDTQVRKRVREAVQHMHALPWYVKPKVYKSPEVSFRRVTSPATREKLVGRSNWEVVQRAFAP